MIPALGFILQPVQCATAQFGLRCQQSEVQGETPNSQKKNCNPVRETCEMSLINFLEENFSLTPTEFVEKKP